ncbi:MAG: WecB/TagA/CpsF family glycosyltransferase [Ignavibacteriaceae bacterium]|jgi:N-acetylglucosaminyldiphosphoundecaprenol N-acetyl-beta-D-mannosaminyltransferase
MYINEIKINNIKDVGLFKKELEFLLSERKTNLIVTFNLDFLRISAENNTFKDVCKNAQIVLADGVGITSLLKLKYGISLHRLTGNDLFQVLLEIANDKKLRLALVGSTTKSLEVLGIKLGKTFPNISLLTISPPFLFETEESTNNKVIDELKNFQPDILIAALGCPRQEIWLSENMNTINARINVGVGAALDFYSGMKKRAPVFLQKIGLEWVWRLFSEPNRLVKRYVFLDLPFFIRLIIKGRNIF